MKRVIIIAALLAAGTAMAQDLVARNGSDYVRLSSKPCSTPAVLALLPAELHDQFQDAITYVGGQNFRGCWMRVPGGQVFLRYEDGDAGLVRYDQFKPSV
jgi:hypothetical protein